VFGPKNVPGKVVLEREGRGKYVGVMLTVDWPYETGYWWGEAEVEARVGGCMAGVRQQPATDARSAGPTTATEAK
jgi:hypothetical protein